MRKFLLLFSIAFVFICYIFPFFVLPFGTYKIEQEITPGTKIESTYKFKLNGKFEINISGVKQEFYYKVKGNKLIVSEDKEFNDKDQKIELGSVYNINGAINSTGKYIAIGVESVALLMALSLPSKKRKSR